MRRRTFRKLKAAVASPATLHHYVYVVLLDPAVLKLRKIRMTNPSRQKDKACLYVGMTGLTPPERFANHKAGIKAARVVRRFGVRLVPTLYEHLNPMSYEDAVRMEVELAESLRKRGFQVFGGH